MLQQLVRAACGIVCPTPPTSGLSFATLLSSLSPLRDEVPNYFVEEEEQRERDERGAEGGVKGKGEERDEREAMMDTMEEREEGSLWGEEEEEEEEVRRETSCVCEQGAEFDHVAAAVWGWGLSYVDEGDFDERDRLHNAALRFHLHYIRFNTHPSVKEISPWLLEATAKPAVFEERLDAFTAVLEEMTANPRDDLSHGRMQPVEDTDNWVEEYSYDHVTTTAWRWALQEEDEDDTEEHDRLHNAAVRFHAHYVTFDGYPIVNHLAPWLLYATADPLEFEARLNIFSEVLENMKVDQNEVKSQENVDYYWQEEYGFDHVTTMVWRWALTQEDLDDVEERDRLHNSALRFHAHYVDFAGYPAVSVMVPWLLDAAGDPTEFEERLGAFSTILEVMRTHQAELYLQPPLVAMPNILFDDEAQGDVNNAERVPFPIWRDVFWGYNFFLQRFLANLPTHTLPHTPLILKIIIPGPSSSPPDSNLPHASAESCLLPKDWAACPHGFLYTVKVIRIGRRD
ncbi:hypothetical protein Hypma_009335 [Hypsizygus marmoreus]|uniref:Uncharacterized protein n=1 Tax=Hypsizygus marmoreus TaxID=39966 RepID=A0A369JNS4_HYPMA|nr:hypothetical protein Hypma_009335 [Hypsizygus marmoreus]